MDEDKEKIKLPENLHDEIQKFFLRTSMPRIRKELEQEDAQKQAPSENND